MTVYNPTISFADQKIGGANTTHHRMAAFAQIRHSLRTDYDTNGHSNPNIDPSRTSRNILFVNGANGLHEAGVDAIAEAEAYYDLQSEQAEKLWRAKNKRSIRKDAVRGRYGTIEIDPLYWSEGAADVDDFFNAGMNFLKETFDERNLVFVALHLDETNPHIQFLTTLRDYDEDGQFRQETWFKGENSYVPIVDACRQYYIDHSDIPTDFTRKPKQPYKVSPEEYTRLKQEAEAEALAEIEQYIETSYKPRLTKIYEELADEEVKRETARQVDESEVVRLANAQAQQIREQADELLEEAEERLEESEQRVERAKRYEARAMQEWERAENAADAIERKLKDFSASLPLKTKEQGRAYVVEQRAQIAKGKSQIPADVWHKEERQDVSGELSL